MRTQRMERGDIERKHGKDKEKEEIGPRSDGSERLLFSAIYNYRCISPRALESSLFPVE